MCLSQNEHLPQVIKIVHLTLIHFTVVIGELSDDLNRFISLAHFLRIDIWAAVVRVLGCLAYLKCSGHKQNDLESFNLCCSVGKSPV